MTIDEACQAAARMLEERGQLLNGHLLRLVNGDKSLFRDVRDALIQTGQAEDRSGVGLVRKETIPGVPHDGVYYASAATNPSAIIDVAVTITKPVTATITEPNQSASDWWLMASGVIKGPFELQTLRRMRMSDEIGPGDVVRFGTSGLWQQPGDVLVPVASEMRDRLQDGGKSRPLQSVENNLAGVGSPESNDLQGPYVPPAKTWTADDRPGPQWFSRGWTLVADLVGGTRRLLQLLIVIAIVGAFSYWWGQPPPVSTIYKEFADCSRTLQKLRERRVGRSEWAPTVNRFRPRIQSLVDRLQYRSHPVQKELFFAGKLGLLPLLDIPANPADSERVFDKHMNAARLLLDNGRSEKPNVSDLKADK